MLKSPKVGRCFEDDGAAERTYFRRTGIVALMHTVVREKLTAAHPEIVKAASKGLCGAKNIMTPQYVGA